VIINKLFYPKVTILT